jgi:hypothetical protein
MPAEAPMAVATFDTLKFANTLKASGVPGPQAEAQAVAIAEVFRINFNELVTKDDLDRAVKLLQGGIDTLAKQTKADIDALAKQTKADIDALAKQTKADIDALAKQTKADIDALAKQTRADLDQMAKELRAEIDRLGRDLRHEIKEESLKLTNQITRLDGRMDRVLWALGLIITLLTAVAVRLFFFKP